MRAGASNPSSSEIFADTSFVDMCERRDTDLRSEILKTNADVDKLLYYYSRLTRTGTQRCSVYVILDCLLTFKLMMERLLA